MLHRAIFFAAKAAAHELADHPHLFVCHAQHAHDLAMVVIDTLAGGVDGKGVVSAGHGQRAFGFEKGVLLAGRKVGCGDHVRCLGERAVDVAALDGGGREQIAVGVQPGRVRRHGRLRRKDGGQFLEVDLDQLNSAARLPLRGGSHQGQGIANVAGLFALGNHDRPVVDDMAEQPLAGHVPGGEHDFHSGGGAGRGDVDAPNQCARNRRPQHRGMQHAGDGHVVDELGAAQQFV